MTFWNDNNLESFSSGEVVNTLAHRADSSVDAGTGKSSGLAFVHEIFTDTEQRLGKVVKGEASSDDYLKLGERALAAGAVTAGVVLGGRAIAAGLEGRATTSLDQSIKIAFNNIKLSAGANDVELPLLSQRLGRRAVLHTGPDFDPAKAQDVLVTMDGLTINKTELDMFGKLSSKTGMSATNGLDQTANRNNFVNLHLYHLPQKALPGVHINGWQSPGAGVLSPTGLLNRGRPKYDDAQYGVDAVSALAKKMNINSLTVAAYADGAEFAPNLFDALATNPATRAIPLQKTALVGGTTYGTERALAPKLLNEVVLVRGSLDPNFPQVGGVGPNTRFLPWLGHGKVLKSKPDAWAAMYKEAAGITDPPIVESTNGVTKAAFVSPDGTRKVTEYTLDGVGSTWPGRTYGVDAQGINHESVVSQRLNGPGSNFDVNDIIAGLVKRGAIKRDLAAVAG
jgi:poly(3-hydroxybutyrate) depolymerase